MNWQLAGDTSTSMSGGSAIGVLIIAAILVAAMGGKKDD